MEIRALRETDDRTAFRSGDPDLDRFFQKFAGQNQFKHYIGTTYVAAEAGRILGFVTVAPGSIEIEDVPSEIARRLPRYPLPILRLARLAVGESARGSGIGAQLLRFVLGLARRMSDEYGCAGVVVDAKPGAAAFYAKYGFVALDTVQGRSDAVPRPTPMFLSMSAIRAAH